MSKLSTTITELVTNPHPGEILLEEFLKPLELSENAVARAVYVPPRDLRLARYLGVSEGFFLGLQADHDLLERRRDIEGELSAIDPCSLD